MPAQNYTSDSGPTASDIGIVGTFVGVAAALVVAYWLFIRKQKRS